MRKVKISNCICMECGNEFPIPRTKKQREKGHNKDLYCIKCKKRTTHIEVRECDFLLSNIV